MKKIGLVFAAAVIAAVTVSPLPCETLSDRAAGRVA